MDNRDDVIQRQLVWNRENADKTRAYKRKYVEKLKRLNIEPITDVIDLEEEYNQYVNAHIQSANTTDVLVHADEDFINGRIRIH
jgi:Trk K+ transport system NAD-binding subunit